MYGQITDLSARMQRGMVLIAAFSAVSMAVPSAAWSQQQAAPPQRQLAPANAPDVSQPAPTAPVPPERSNPGFLEEVGKVLKDSATGLKDAASGLTSKIPSPQDTLNGINSGTKSATDGLSNITPSLSPQTVIAGRTMCPPAPNGAPDCKLASDQLCREKGYKEGRSVDIETAQKCSAKSYFAGNGACRTENFVTRAVCN